MNLKDLNLPDLETLESWTDEQVTAHFSKFLEICKPRFVTEKKATGTSKKKKVSLSLGDAKPKQLDIDAIMKKLEEQAARIKPQS